MPGRHALFVYGTLVADECQAAVTGRTFPRRPALLPDYTRIHPPGGYPYIVPSPGARVRGTLLSAIDDSALQALDRYEDEGRLYVRRVVEVQCDRITVPCYAYVGLPGAHGNGPSHSEPGTE